MMAASRFRKCLAGLMVASAIITSGCEKSENSYTSNTNSVSSSHSGSEGSNADNSPDNDSSYANPSTAFSIDYPQSGASLEKDIISIKGSGIKREVADLSTFVRTDRWWGQAGTHKLGRGGSWSYSPVYLRGRGSYNNHSIRVVVNYRDGGQETAQVDGIIRTGPLTGP